jgi:hypothetical protein
MAILSMVPCLRSFAIAIRLFLYRSIAIQVLNAPVVNAGRHSLGGGIAFVDEKAWKGLCVCEWNLVLSGVV